MITLFSNNKEIPVNKITFSDQAITFKLDKLPSKPRYISINVHPSTPVKDVREEVDMILNCIDNFYGDSTGFVDISLNLPYLPYARADRVFENGNPSPLYDFLVWLDRKRFSQINVCDMHNSKVLDEYPVDNLRNKSQLQCFKESLPCDFDEYYDYVIAPDKGAKDKAKTIAQYLETDIAYAEKKRNISTGKIEGITLPNINLVNAKVLIPDDIGDYGNTFIQLAKLLKDRGAQEVHLYVTHAICAGGLSKFKGLIDKIYYYNVVGNYINNEHIMRFNNES